MVSRPACLPAQVGLDALLTLLSCMSKPTPACVVTCRLLRRTGSKSAPWTKWSSSYVRSSGQAHASSRRSLQLHGFLTAGCMCTVLCARSLAQRSKPGLLPLACSTPSHRNLQVAGRGTPIVTILPHSLCLLDHVWLTCHTRSAACCAVAHIDLLISSRAMF